MAPSKEQILTYMWCDVFTADEYFSLRDIIEGLPDSEFEQVFGVTLKQIENSNAPDMHGTIIPGTTSDHERVYKFFGAWYTPEALREFGEVLLARYPHMVKEDYTQEASPEKAKSAAFRRKSAEELRKEEQRDTAQAHLRKLGSELDSMAMARGWFEGTHKQRGELKKVGYCPACEVLLYVAEHDTKFDDCPKCSGEVVVA